MAENKTSLFLIVYLTGSLAETCTMVMSDTIRTTRNEGELQTITMLRLTFWHVVVSVEAFSNKIRERKCNFEPSTLVQMLSEKSGTT